MVRQRPRRQSTTYDTSSESETKTEIDVDLTRQARRAREIVARLRETGNDQSHVEHDVKLAIAATDGIDSNDLDPRTVDRYLDLVTEEMDLSQHPRTPDLWVPSEDLPKRPDHIPWSTGCRPTSSIQRAETGRSVLEDGDHSERCRHCRWSSSVGFDGDRVDAFELVDVPREDGCLRSRRRSPGNQDVDSTDRLTAVE